MAPRVRRRVDPMKQPPRLFAAVLYLVSRLARVGVRDKVPAPAASPV